MRHGQRETKTPTRARIARALVVSAIGLTTADILILGCLLTHEGHVLVVASVRGALDDVKQASVDLVFGDLRADKLSVNHVQGGDNIRVAPAGLP